MKEPQQKRLLDTAPTIPSTPIRSTKEQRGTDGLPLFDANKIKHEEAQEQRQQSFGFTGSGKARR